MKQFIITWADSADEYDIENMEEAIDQCLGDFSFKIIDVS
jgi:hypothetical protein